MDASSSPAPDTSSAAPPSPAAPPLPPSPASSGGGADPDAVDLRANPNAVVVRRVFAFKRDFAPEHARPKRHLMGVRLLPPRVDLREVHSAPGLWCEWDQGSLGSCTTHPVLQSVLLLLARKHKHTKEGGGDGGAPAELSRLFLYYQERLFDGDVGGDGGSTYTTAVRVLRETGCCTEALWPYRVAQFAQRPPRACYQEARRVRLKAEEWIAPTEHSIKQCLADGYPICLGLAIHESFQTAAVARTGQVPLPRSAGATKGAADAHLGDHAVLLCGYDDATRRFLLKNSWGAQWGERGFFYVPYEYVLGGEFVASDLLKIADVDADLGATADAAGEDHVPVSVPATGEGGGGALLGAPASAAPDAGQRPPSAPTVSVVIVDEQKQQGRRVHEQDLSRGARQERHEQQQQPPEDVCAACGDCCGSCFQFLHKLLCLGCAGLRWLCGCCGCCCQPKRPRVASGAKTRRLKPGRNGESARV